MSMIVYNYSKIMSCLLDLVLCASKTSYVLIVLCNILLLEPQLTFPTLPVASNNELL